MSIKNHELLGVPKHANQHRLSRLTMETHTDELRILASAVENYTDQLIAALEAAEKRVAELEAREVTLPEVRITAAESRRRNMTWRELGAYNEGADVAVEKISKMLSISGIRINGEG